MHYVKKRCKVCFEKLRDTIYGWSIFMSSEIRTQPVWADHVAVVLGKIFSYS